MMHTTPPNDDLEAGGMLSTDETSDRPRFHFWPSVAFARDGGLHAYMAGRWWARVWLLPGLFLLTSVAMVVPLSPVITVLRALVRFKEPGEAWCFPRAGTSRSRRRRCWSCSAAPAKRRPTAYWLSLRDERKDLPRWFDFPNVQLCASMLDSCAAGVALREWRCGSGAAARLAQRAAVRAGSGELQDKKCRDGFEDAW